MRGTFGFLVSALAAVAIAGCTPGAGAVRAQAARDLSCPEKEVVVHELSLGRNDDALYEARGCGKRVEYWVKGREIRQHQGEWYFPR
jgi:hypothetical protein